MKKLIWLMALAIVVGAVATSCNNSKKDADEDQDQTADLSEELSAAKNQQDSLIVLLTEMADGMNEIMRMENIVNSSNLSQESQTTKDDMKNNMNAIAQELAARRTKIEELEKKLKQSGNLSSQTQKSIESMKAQIETQQQEIDKLNKQLEEANKKISDLTDQNNTLNKTVATVTSEKDAAKAEAARTADELNTCYYAIGSNKELKSHNIIQKKFLGRTKVMEGDYEMSYFTKGDKRKLKSIPLHTTKAKVMTTQPEDSYEITEDSEGSLVLKITNSSKFWEKSNFLVIQIN